MGAIGLGAMPLSTKEPRPSPDGGRGRGARGPRRRGDADRHRRRLRPRRGGVRAQRGAGGRRRCARTAGTADVLVATKGGHTRAGTDWGLDGSPAYLRRACEASLRRLRRRRDRALPVPPARPGDAVGGVDGRRCGRWPTTGWCGWSASRTPTSPRSTPPGRSSATRWSACRTSSRRATAPRPTSWRTARRTGWPGCRGARSAGCRRPARWTRQAPAFAEVADELGVSVYRVTLAWHLAQADVVLPIPGASRPASIVDSAAAADLTLTPDQLARLERRLSPAPPLS